MTEENKTESAPETKPSVVQYAVHSVARSRHNRTARAALPQKPKRKQYIGAEQLRLTHGRPRIITEEQLRKDLADYKAKQAAHILEVRTLDGRAVDLETLQPMTAAQAAAQTRPAFPLDSVNRDKNFPGIAIQPPYTSDDLTVPQVLKDGEKPALFEHAKEAAQAADESTAAESSPVESSEEPDEAATAAKEEVSSEKKGGGSRSRRK